MTIPVMEITESSLDIRLRGGKIREPVHTVKVIDNNMLPKLENSNSKWGAGI